MRQSVLMFAVLTALELLKALSLLFLLFFSLDLALHLQNKKWFYFFT
jgi:hypothetical protein